MHVWLARRLSALGGQAGPLLVGAPTEYGGAQLIGAMELPERPLVWLEPTPEDAADPVALGNLLAAAAERGLGARLLPYGVSFGYGLATLQAALVHIGPVTLAVSHARAAPDFVRALLALQRAACRVVLQCEGVPPEAAHVPGARCLTRSDLRLTKAEALELTAGRLPDADALALLEATDGAVELFSSELHRTLSLPSYLFPGPLGPRALPGYAPEVDAGGLLALLIRNKRWQDALELAVHRLPERAPEVLEEAGHSYHEQGLHRRLWGLFERLPPELRTGETARYWRLECAFRLGRQDELRAEVTSYLKAHEAPALRAMAAGVFVPTSPDEARRAHEAEPTPFTTYVLGRLSTGPEAVEVLRESVSAAEQGGRPYEVVRNAGALAVKLLFWGEFQESADWGAWALREYARFGVKDGQRYLLIVNNWAYARLLTGDLAGLEPLLRETAERLEEAEPHLALLYRSTLGNYLMASGRPLEALVFYRQNLEVASRWNIGVSTFNLVQTLLELGEDDDALKIARENAKLLEDIRETQSMHAVLAHGMALCAHDPAAALPVLARAREGFRRFEYSAHRIAQASLYLALVYRLLGDADAAEELLFAPHSHLQGLAQSGLRLLSGPEARFRPIWARLLGTGAPLELRFMGAGEAWLDGERVKAYPQWLEILAVLVIRGKPLTLGELLADLYGDGGNKATLKATLARLRHDLPVSTHPYRIEAPFHVDFQEVQSLLERGDLGRALARYRGPLLPASDAPLIREADEVLAESLRRAALSKGDPDALLALSQHFPDDLELLEAAAAALAPGDPRASLVEARLEALRAAWGV